MALWRASALNTVSNAFAGRTIGQRREGGDLMPVKKKAAKKTAKKKKK
jgi:hypothetical protein